MADPVKRRYRSELREEAAGQTRRRIREAASGRFVRQGYVSTTVRDIADDAGVSVRTVFNAYPGGKADIFAEALDVALGEDEDRIPLRLRPVTRDVLEQQDPHLMVAAVVDGAVSLYERAGPLIATYQGSAGADAEMRRHADAGAHEARRIMRQVGRALHRVGGLRSDLSAEQAGDALLALCSPQVHELLRERCGWSATTYRSWLLDTIERTITTSN